MTAIPSSVAASVEILVKAFPVEDIWYLEAGDAPECGLERPHNLIVAVRDGEEAHRLEPAMRARLQDAAEDVHVFPLAAFERIPRPLLVKMALTHGESVFRR
ncbi:MAG TPA: hypothetical protein PLS03_05170 [Terrimicrobiaceae bacterium]|nr:hypothetical protein [Terrimicrobiaceae bacterium]